MNYRDMGCPDCKRVTSGDCGKHGPMTFTTAIFPPVVATPFPMMPEPDRLEEIREAMKYGDFGRVRDIAAELVQQVQDLRAALDRKGEGFCEAHYPPFKSCPCCEAVHQADLLAEAQATIAQLTGEVLAKDEAILHLTEQVEQAEAARDKIAKELRELEKYCTKNGI